MTKKQTELSEELREAVFEAARAGAAEAYTQNTGYVNYFKAMETLLYNYKKLAALVADEEAYCEVEYHAGRKTFSTTPQAKGFIQRKTEAEIVEEMREEKQKQFKETKSGFDSLTRAISLFEGHKEFVVIRLYYFGEDINGNPREGGTATWEEIAEELSALADKRHAEEIALTKIDSDIEYYGQRISEEYGETYDTALRFRAS